MLKSQLASESFPAAEEGGPPRFYSQLPPEEQGKLLTARLKKYCQKAWPWLVDRSPSLPPLCSLSFAVSMPPMFNMGSVWPLFDPDLAAGYGTPVDQ